MTSPKEACSSPQAGRFIRAVLGWGPFLAPLLYLGLIFWLHPRDRLGDPDTPIPLGRLVYDDFDPAAMALRGLNASLGRSAGRLDEPPSVDVNEFSNQLHQSRPFEPRYFLEYPHAALWLFQLGYLLQPGSGKLHIPAVLADAAHHNLVWHVPRNEEERRLWQRLHRAIQIYRALMIACLIGLMAALRWGYEPGRRLLGPIGLLILPAALYFSANRFDVVPALFVALSFACLGRRWIVLSAVFLGMATMVKVFPVLLVPLMIRYLSNRRYWAVTWTFAFAAIVSIFLLPPLLQFGWEVTWAPYQYQLSRHYEAWGTIYNHLLPALLAGDQPVWRLLRTGSVLVVALGLAWSRPCDLPSLLQRALVTLIVFVMVQVFYSPQWLVWFLPLLVPLAGLNRRTLLLAVALDLVTFFTFPVVFDLQTGQAPAALLQKFADVALAVLVYARFLLLAVLLWVVGRQSS